MDEYDQWVQSQLQPHDKDLHTTHQDSPPPSSSDAWASASSSSTASASLPSVHDSRALDVPDFADLGAPTLSFQPASYYSSQYNTLGYGMPWPPPQAQQQQLPLSSYSTLNGATSSRSGPESHSPPTQPLLIDPALTTTSGSASNGISPYHFYASPSNSHQTQQPHSPSTSHTHLAYPSLGLNHSYLHNSVLFQQLQSQAQGTLSPHALHTPSPSLIPPPPPAISPLRPSSTQSLLIPVPSKPNISPEQRKSQFITSLKPLLQPSSFSGAQAVATLTDKIQDFGPQDVDAATKLDILTKIRDKAGNHYFRAWSENSVALDITREWLKAGTTAKPDSPLVDTIMPLLHIIDRLPLTVESLKTSKLGKIIVKLTKEPPSPAVKDMASNIERRWRQMVSNPDSASLKETNEDRAKKRKLNESTSNPKAVQPNKRVALSSASAKPVVKKEVVSASTASAKTGAKTDSSFFSAPKPKPKLPSFKKAPVPPPGSKKDDASVAQPSAIDPFQEALKAMGKSRKESPSNSITPPPTLTTLAGTSVITQPTKGGKKKKRVTWAADNKLEAVKIIERAVYEDDGEGMHTSLRDLDRGEGAALIAHLFEEAIDWTEPLPIETPPDIEIQDRGTQSSEKATQELREQTALSAVYMSAAHIPDSPAEPSAGILIPDEEVDKEVKIMITGPDVDEVFWSGPAPTAIPGGITVADLVGQLSDGVGVDGDVTMGNPTSKLETLTAMQAALPPEQLQHLLAQLTQPGSMFSSLFAGQQHPYINDASMMNNDQQYADYSSYHQPQDDNDQRNQWTDNYKGRGGRGFRGRGRGRGDDGFRHSRRKPCSFFQAGRKVSIKHCSVSARTDCGLRDNRCKYGDQCDFSHDPIPY